MTGRFGRQPESRHLHGSKDLLTCGVACSLRFSCLFFCAHCRWFFIRPVSNAGGDIATAAKGETQWQGRKNRPEVFCFRHSHLVFMQKGKSISTLNQPAEAYSGECRKISASTRMPEKMGRLNTEPKGVWHPAILLRSLASNQSVSADDQNSPIGLPSALSPRLFQVVRSIFSLMNRTAPSHRTA